ncbi:MAG: hypothetical protein KF862_08265 [Chitinophagaceae bacterium]|nr:hypothetical protein [Chitinophagaceae bacterium]
MNNDQIYSIPARFRRIENLHILLWLLKDVCWALNFRVMGMIMIIPTLTVAVLITWQTRKLTAELLHNLAVVCWITANCLWMTGEFFGWDEGKWGARHLALIPFILGLLVLAYFYLFLVPSKRSRQKMQAQKQEILEQEKKTGNYN